jgi:hypothetical protein
MKASQYISEITKWMDAVGDRDISLAVSIDGNGMYMGEVKSIGVDAENNIIVEGNVDKESVI